MRKRSVRCVGVMLGLILLLGAQRAAAAESPAPAEEDADKVLICPICSKASSEDATYGTKAGYTLTRGATNTLLGWTEMFRRPVDEVKKGGNVFSGIGAGVSHSVTRTLGGLGEVFTFWTPKIQNSYVHLSDDCPICMGKR